MRIGINSYSFHRLLGELRPGELPSGGRLADGGVVVIDEARALGCEVVGLQTCFLSSERFDAGALRHAAGELELIIEWGHPEGLAFGTRPEAEADLLDWLERAAALETRLFRVVIGGPRLRAAEPLEVQLSRSVAPLRRCADRAAELGLEMAVENHADLTTMELVELIDRVERSNVGICLDVANALRLGDDPSRTHGEATSLVRMVHLRDIEPMENVADPIAGPATVPLGEGVAPLRETLARLSEPLAARTPVLVEVGQVGPTYDEFELIISGLDWLRAYRNRWLGDSGS